MASFDTFFAEYLKSCAKLYNAFLPWSLAIMVLAFPFEFARGNDPRRLMFFLAKLIVLVLLTSQSWELINSSQRIVDQFVRTTGLVRSETLAQTYKDRVAATLGQPEIQDKSVFDLMMSGKLLDSACYASLLGAAYCSLFVITLITYVQKVTLALCWSVTPVLFALIAVEPWAHIGMKHVNRIIAVCCWPIGFCLAATFTDSLLNMAIKERLLASDASIKSLAVALENLIIIAAIGVWDVISTIGAPVFIHRFLVGESDPGRFVPEAINKVGGVIMVPIATAGIAAIKKVASYFKGSDSGGDQSGGGTGGNGGPPPPSPPPPPSTTPPSARSGKADPTGAKEPAKLLKDK
jgi:type IV secretion system protein TrbL